MLFTNDMTFQYFFFDTYIGYFCQALPIALLVSAIYGFVRFKKDKAAPVGKKLLSCVFVCYMTGLICLVVGLDLMGMFWYELFYPMDSGIEIGFFSGEFDLVPDFFSHISGEAVGNFLMFLPFGALYPLSVKNPTWKKTVTTGLCVVVVIEVLQPVFGRAFDINDVILNTLGILVSTAIFTAIKGIARR